jgi:hypothetical protein
MLAVRRAIRRVIGLPFPRRGTHRNEQAPRDCLPTA